MTLFRRLSILNRQFVSNVTFKMALLCCFLVCLFIQMVSNSLEQNVQAQNQVGLDQSKSS